MKPLFPTLIAVFLIVAGFGFLFVQSEPVGQVAGSVRFAKDKRPFGRLRVTLVPERDDDTRRWRTHTDPQGHFLFRQVPVGSYRIVTAAEHHSNENKPIPVTEAQTSTVEVALTPNGAALELAYTQQRTWGTRETPTLAITGIGKTGARLDVTLYRARLTELVSQPERASALSRIGNAWSESLNELPAALAPLCTSPTQESTEPIVRTDREGFFTMRLPLRGVTGKPGLYLVRLRHEKLTLWSWVHLTDTALITRYAPSERKLLAFVVDIEKGTPRPGAQVRHFVAGQQLATGVTDSNGLLTLNDVPQTGTATLVTVGSDETLIYDGRTPGGEETRPLVAHTITDRTLYRPGQTIFYKTILRRPQPGNAYQYALPAGEPATVTITDPSGLEVLKESKTVTASGAVIGQFSVSTEGQTGFYDLKVTVGGQDYTQSIELAAYKKPEFSVTVAPARPRLLRSEPLEATISASYYFGAPVAQGKVRWSLSRETDWAADYDNTGWPSQEEDVIGEDYGSGSFVAEGEGTLDETGHLKLSLSTKPEAGSGERDLPPTQVERYTLTASITDAAGREMEKSATVSVTTADLKVALTPEGYVARTGQPTRVFVTVRDHDGKPAAGAPVTLRGERVGKVVLPAQSGTTGADGRAALSVTLPVSGDIELLASARDRAGREARTHQTLWVTPANEQEPDTTRLSQLTLATDKRSYAPGETAQVVIGTAETGQTVLLTVEGERLYKTIAVPIRQSVTRIALPVLEAYGPNVSLAALCVVGKQLQETETPLRVTLPRKTLSIALTADKPQYEPGEDATFTATVTDAEGKPVQTELALSVADEALYALRDDDPKALRKAFYPLRTSEIRTRHSFEILYLAGENKDGITVKTREKFVDTAYWNPALRTDAQGVARVRFALPDNLTTWRAVVHAVSDATAVGYARAKVVVNRPFFVRLETPRFVVEGDQVRLTGLVHNNSGASQSAHVRLTAPGLPLSEMEKTLSVATGTVGEVSWSWTVPANQSESVALKLESWTETKLDDGVKLALTVRPFGRESIRTLPVAPSVALTLPPDAVPERTFLTVRATPSLRELVEEATDYLRKYPYGCVEQTVSRFVPLIVAKAADPKLVQEGVARLSAMRQGAKGWGWWYRDGFDLWHTAYAVWGLSEARAAGYPVPEELLAQGAKPLWSELVATKAPTPATAFALFAASRVDAGRAQRLSATLLPRFGSPREKQPETLAWLVLFCREVGLDPSPFAQALEAQVRQDGTFAHWGEGRIPTALALRALPQTTSREKALGYLLSTGTEGYFGNTRETAFVIWALTTMPEFGTAPGRMLPTTVRLKGKLLPLQARGRGFEATIPGTELTRGADSTLEKSGPGYVAAVLRQSVRSAELPALDADGLRVRREFVRLASGPKGLLPEAPSTRFAQGETVRVRLIVETKRTQEFVLLEDRFPAGFEPNARGTLEDDDTGESQSFWYSHLDVRDDRLALFARSLPPGKHVFEYHLRAQTPGRAHALPATLTPMYATNLRAETEGTVLEIR